MARKYSRRSSRRVRKVRKQTKRVHKMRGGGPYEDEIRRVLYLFRNDFQDKRVLDIGSRDGLNCITLAGLGAREVIGIDLDDSRFGEMPANPKVRLIKADLLTFHDEEKFDIITCFLWNMPVPQYQAVMDKIKELLKPGGKVIIGFHDALYKEGYINSTGRSYPNTGSVPELLERNFNNSNTIHNGYQQIMMASDPK